MQRTTTTSTVEVVIMETTMVEAITEAVAVAMAEITTAEEVEAMEVAVTTVAVSTTSDIKSLRKKNQRPKSSWAMLVDSLVWEEDEDSYHRPRVVKATVQVQAGNQVDSIQVGL